MYQLIIFDWDGTIIDSAQKIANSMLASARAVGVDEPSVQEAKNIIGLGLPEAMQTLFPNCDSETQHKIIEAYRHQFVTADNTPQPLFSGVEKGLSRLNEAGVFVAVATGKSRVGLERALDVHNLRDQFLCSRCADETRSKPHPQMLFELLEYTAIDPHKAIMIGDTTYDMDMARNAKVHALGAGYGVHTEHDLVNSGALDVMNSFEAVIDWLCEGRLEQAHG